MDSIQSTTRSILTAYNLILILLYGFNEPIASINLRVSLKSVLHRTQLLHGPVASLQVLKENCAPGTGHQHGAHSLGGTEEVIRIVRGMGIQMSTKGFAHETSIRAISGCWLLRGIAGWARRIGVVVVASTTVQATALASYGSVTLSSTASTNRIHYTTVTQGIEVSPRGTRHHRRSVSSPFADPVLVPQSGGKSDANILTGADNILNLSPCACNCQ